MSSTTERPALPPVRAVICDFDGTLVNADVLDELCGLMGMQERSRELNEQFVSGQMQGIAALVARINMLTGLPLADLRAALGGAERLTPGALELFGYCRSRGILTVIASGSITPVLEHYQRLLGADAVLGPQPYVHEGKLAGMDERNSPPEGFKLLWVRELLAARGISAAETVAIGDSPSETGLFAFASLACAIHPKGGIEQAAHVLLPGTLAPVIGLIEARSQR